MNDFPSPPASTQEPQIQAIIGQLRIAWYSRRSIVPIVGAGLSVDSGIPILRSVVRYFGKFHQYLKTRSYLPQNQEFREMNPLNALGKRFEAEPRLFVEHFGWPDRFELNQDLLYQLEQSARNPETASVGPPNRVAESVLLGLKGALQQINPLGYAQYDWLEKSVNQLLSESTGRFAALRAEVDLLLNPRPGAVPTPGAGTGHDDLREKLWQILALFMKGLREDVYGRLERDGGSSVPFDLVGDWKKLIQFFTGYQGDYADALFSRLCAGRGPSLGHRYLAFLVKLLGIKTILTFNFDELIERSLEFEGVHPKVFAMEEGVGLPHVSLVRDTVSVIKLHGNNHALLLDERLDHPLSAEYKARFDLLAGRDPLLFVIGCSGGDYRLRDLVTHVLQRGRGEARKPRLPQVIWLHFEEKPPAFLHEYMVRVGREDLPAVMTAIINNPGATLMHCYSAMTGRHPASGVPYISHVQRPIKMWWFVKPPAELSPAVGTAAAGPALSSPGDQPDKEQQLHEPHRKFAVISTLGAGLAGKQGTYPLRTASQALFEAATYWQRRGYHNIWVDLEAVHTLAGVVGCIIDQCRQYDTSLAPSVLPVDDQDHLLADALLQRAVDHVTRALRRSRYLVALDGLETYLWPPTTHHGETTMSAVPGGTRLRNMMRFIEKLWAEDRVSLGESKVFLSVDLPKQRHEDGRVKNRWPVIKKLLNGLIVGKEDRLVHIRGLDNPLGRFTKVFVPLKGEVETAPIVTLSGKVAAAFPTAPVANDEPHPLNTQSWALVLHVLSCFRRTRHLVALRHLLRPVVGSRESIDAILNALTAIDPKTLESVHPELGLIRLEGGGLWFNRTVRDYLYSENSKWVSTEEMKKYLNHNLNEGEKRQVAGRFPSAVAQLFLLATTHQRVARTYYTWTFVQSHDTFAFLEYTYHRLSSIRYQAKLLAMISAEFKTKAFAGKALQGLQLCGQLLWRGIPNRLDFEDMLRRMEVESGFRARKQQKNDHTKTPANQKSALWRALDPSSNLQPGLLSKNSPPKLLEIEKELKKRHAREVRSLYRAWMRSEGAIRAQLPAEQLLHWCDALLNDELPFRCNRVVIGYDKQSAPKFPEWLKGPVNHLAEPAIEAFRAFLEDFRVKLWIERSDYERCVSQRYKMLSDPPLKLLRPWTASQSKFTAACFEVRDACLPPSPGQPAVSPGGLKKRSLLRLVHLHYLLDVAACFIKQAQAAPEVLEEAWKLLEHIDTLLETFFVPLVSVLEEPAARRAASLESYPRGELATFVSDCHEARLRLQHLKIEVHLHDVSVFALDFRGEKLPSRLACDHHHARAEIEEGLSRVREQDPHTGGPLRSVVVEPTPDGCLYLQYRAIFHMLRGRSDWLHLVGTLAPGDKQFEEQFEMSFRNFELARGGLGESNRLIAALNELYVVEACLGHARINLAAARRKPVEDQEAAIDEAGAKYETARLALQRAQQAMLATRRNVIWWRFYYLMVGQYHADRLLLGLAKVLKNWPPPENDQRRYPFLGGDLAQHLVRLRRGYTAIRSALDYKLHREKTSVSPWLLRIWREMTAASYAVGVIALRGYVADQYTRFGSASHPFMKEQEYVWDLLAKLNETAGIRKSSDPLLFLSDKQQREIKERLLDDYFLASGKWRLPLELRWELIGIIANPDSEP